MHKLVAIYCVNPKNSKNLSRSVSIYLQIIMPSLRCPVCNIAFPRRTDEQTITEHMIECSSRRRGRRQRKKTNHHLTTSAPAQAPVQAGEKCKQIVGEAGSMGNGSGDSKTQMQKGFVLNKSKKNRVGSGLASITLDTSTNGGEGDVAAGLLAHRKASGSPTSIRAGGNYDRSNPNDVAQRTKRNKQGAHDLRHTSSRYECPVCQMVFCRTTTPLDELQSHVVYCTDLNESINGTKMEAAVSLKSSSSGRPSKRKGYATASSAAENKACKAKSPPKHAASKQKKTASKAQNKRDSSRCGFRSHVGAVNLYEHDNRARDLQYLASGRPKLVFEEMALSELDSLY